MSQAIADKAAIEFDRVPEFLSGLEAICGPYQWGRLDVLVLPANFPYGGMENPNLIYVTPNIVIGDKSLCRVMLHEIAHSWSGNLVTNAEWQHFWLNEGLTVFLESRVLKRLFNEEFYALLMEDKVKELRTSIDD